MGSAVCCIRSSGHVRDWRAPGHHGILAAQSVKRRVGLVLGRFVLLHHGVWTVDPVQVPSASPEIAKDLDSAAHEH